VQAVGVCSVVAGEEGADNAEDVAPESQEEALAGDRAARFGPQLGLGRREGLPKQHFSRAIDHALPDLHQRAADLDVARVFDDRGRGVRLKRGLGGLILKIAAFVGRAATIFEAARHDLQTATASSKPI